MSHHHLRKSESRSASPSSWWASAAYAKRDLDGAKKALIGSRLLQASHSEWRAVFSSMARGEALIRGALDFKPSKDDDRRKNAAFYRVIQWRLVMSYAGLEIFAKPLIKTEQAKSRGGLAKGDFQALFEKLNLMDHPPLETPRIKRMLSKKVSSDASQDRLEAIVDFMGLRNHDKALVSTWLKGSPVVDYSDACCLARAFRNTIAHGSLSPQKTRDLGLQPALVRLSKTCDEVRRAVLARLYDEHHGQR